MKSKLSQDQSFSMTDFEKGLVLAGILTPQTTRELEEIEALEEYESNKKKQSKAVFFKRVVLSAEIVSALYEEPTFGRVKFQKLVYLCEHAALMNLQERYLKLVAGPFDNKFMHTIEAEFKRQKWFTVEKVFQAPYTRTKYIPLDNFEGHKKYYSSYFQQSEEDIRQIISLFRKKNTAFAEISATLLACYLELTEKNLPYDEERLLSFFYEWSTSKQKYDRSTVLENWAWMLENGLVKLQ